jgi:CheY-like chemotaxis protein
MLGHELRNPLAAVRTSVEVLNVGGINDPQSALEHCRAITRQTVTLTRLVDDLLDVTRISTGKIVLNRSLLDLREVAGRALETVKLAVAVSQHELSFAAPDAAVVVHGDPVRLEQIITNLLGNALKYTPLGGRVSLSVGHNGGQAFVRVQDTGDGIPSELLSRIFEPFVQVDKNVVKSRGGIGLGLSVVKALAEMHGGTVSAESEGLGRGSAFTIQLPLHAGQVTIAAPQPPEASMKQTGCRVLVVEDSADSRFAMRQLLRFWGHDVVVAEDGPQGVQKADEFKPQVALIDIGLPGLDGYHVAMLMRECLGESVRLIAMTGYTQEEDRQRASAAGFDCHLSKPVDPAQLAHLLNELARG